jgi:hypothetical protein
MRLAGSYPVIMSRNTAEPEKERAIELLIAGVSPPEIARQLNLGRTTVWRWQQDPEFVAELEAVRGDRRKMVQAALIDCALEAVDVLMELMRDRDIPAAVRVRAAESLLSRVSLDSMPEPTSPSKSFRDLAMAFKQAEEDWRSYPPPAYEDQPR